MLKEYLKFNETKKANPGSTRKLCVILSRYLETGNIIDYETLFYGYNDDIIELLEPVWIDRLNQTYKKKEYYGERFLFDQLKKQKPIEIKQMFNKYTNLNYDEIINIIHEKKYEDLLLEDCIKELLVKDYKVNKIKKYYTENAYRETIIDDKKEENEDKIIDNKIIDDNIKIDDDKIIDNKIIDDKIINDTIIDDETIDDGTIIEKKYININLTTKILIENKEKIEYIMSNIKTAEYIDDIIKILDEKNNIKKKIQIKNTKKPETILLKDSEKNIKYNIEWHYLINKNIKRKSNEIYKACIERLLLFLNQSIDTCNLSIFTQHSTFNKIQDYLIKKKNSTKYAYYKIINIYLSKYLQITKHKIDYGLSNMYEQEQMKYENELMDLKSVINFNDLLDKINFIMNNKKINNDYRIILYIYMYGYKTPDQNPIGVLRYSDLLNTVHNMNGDENIKLNNIDYINKKWIFNENFTKNKKHREFDIDDEFLNGLKQLRFSKSEKLLSLPRTCSRNIYRWNIKYNLKSLNEMRKSCEIYINSGIMFKDRGEKITYQMGHSKKVANRYYNRRDISENYIKQNEDDSSDEEFEFKVQDALNDN